jgi:PleD family two-component response regulator
MVDEADNAMCQAKRGGRNRIAALMRCDCGQR